jgi:hypothetical protein
MSTIVSAYLGRSVPLELIIVSHFHFYLYLRLGGPHGSYPTTSTVS